MAKKTTNKATKDDKPKGGVLAKLIQFADWKDRNNPAINVATVEVRTETMRRLLGKKKGEPLVFRGLSLRCVGSKAWRQENQFRGDTP